MIRNTLLALLLMTGLSAAHTVDYQVDQSSATVVTVRLGDEVASYSEYEIFAPVDRETPFQIGRTDAQGRVVFLPTTPGVWKVKVSAESQHGLHGQIIEIKVDDTNTAEIVSRPLVAKHTRLVVGVSVLFGIFGLWSLVRGRQVSRSTEK